MKKQELIDNLNHVAYQTVLENMHGNTGLIESCLNYIFETDFTLIEEVYENNVYLSVSVNHSSISVELEIGVDPEALKSVDDETIELLKEYIQNEIDSRRKSAKEIKETEDSLNRTEH